MNKDRKREKNPGGKKKKPSRKENQEEGTEIFYLFQENGDSVPAGKTFPSNFCLGLPFPDSRTDGSDRIPRLLPSRDQTVTSGYGCEIGTTAHTEPTVLHFRGVKSYLPSTRNRPFSRSKLLIGSWNRLQTMRNPLQSRLLFIILLRRRHARNRPQTLRSSVLEF